MRLRAWTATSTSVDLRPSIRERRPSPITCFHRPKQLSELIQRWHSSDRVIGAWTSGLKCGFYTQRETETDLFRYITDRTRYPLLPLPYSQSPPVSSSIPVLWSSVHNASACGLFPLPVRTGG